MLKDTIDFFEKKKEWSKIKDELLACYLEPYFVKILQTNKPINYIDCFAGKGKFDNGDAGSPIIALNAIKNAKQKTHSLVSNTKIKSYFIEPKYSNELINNLLGYSNVKIIKDNYAENIDTILKNQENENVFFCIDSI